MIYKKRESPKRENQTSEVEKCIAQKTPNDIM